LLQSITTHEDRLTDIQLNVEITEIEKFQLFKQFTEIKKRVDIQLTGTIRKTGEAFAFRKQLVFEPPYCRLIKTSIICLQV
jgi:hypothetical protein